MPVVIIGSFNPATEGTEYRIKYIDEDASALREHPLDKTAITSFLNTHFSPQKAGHWPHFTMRVNEAIMEASRLATIHYTEVVARHYPHPFSCLLAGRF